MTPEKHPDYPGKLLGPDELLATQTETIPEEVFMAVNGLIIERLAGEYARFTVGALRKRMVELGLESQEIKQRGWDKVGSLYKAAGWNVTYETPSYDSLRDFEPYYCFKTNGQRSW